MVIGEVAVDSILTKGVDDCCHYCYSFDSIMSTRTCENFKGREIRNYALFYMSRSKEVNLWKNIFDYLCHVTSLSLSMNILRDLTTSCPIGARVDCIGEIVSISCTEYNYTRMKMKVKVFFIDP